MADHLRKFSDSSNGDQWFLGRDEAGRARVLHKANVPSGGTSCRVRKPGGGTISVDFGAGPVNAVRVPWGDVFTAYFSTGIPDIEDYVAAPPALQRQLAIGRMIAPGTKWAPIRNLLLMAVRPGPSAELRGADQNARLGRSRRRTGPSGRVEAAWAGSGTRRTTITALGAARKALNCAAKAGYQTPASAFGKDFVLEGEGVTREEVA